MKPDVLDTFVGISEDIGPCKSDNSITFQGDFTILFLVVRCLLFRSIVKVMSVDFYHKLTPHGLCTIHPESSQEHMQVSAVLSG